VLRTQLLGTADFRDPGAVLEGLNRVFPMAENNEKYFTIWYGVYHIGSRELAFASGGHHAAVMVCGDDRVQPLRTTGPGIGMMPGVEFPSARIQVPPGAELYLFSDGVYEIARPDGSWQSWDEFARLLRQERPSIDAIVGRMRKEHGAEDFEDDFSLLRLKLA
jgi:sigma-B regulation protein RsbU (phosphoserine phosphatase)